MSYKKYTVILTGIRNNIRAVKLSGEFDGGAVKVECKPSKQGVEHLYIIGDEIAKLTLEHDKTEYKAVVKSKCDIICAIENDGEYVVGGTGKVPSARSVAKKIEEWEKRRASQNSTSRTSETPVRANARDNVNPRDCAHTARACETKSAVSADAEPEFQPDKSTDVQTDSKVNASARRSDGAASVLDEGIRYDGTNFYLAVKPQLDELFVRYPSEPTLNSIVPNSRWVRVDAPDGYYVVGVLYDLSSPSFICYGIPSAFQKQPPPEIADVAVWLPLSLDKRDGDGYWVIYQSAVDGKCVR